MPIIKSWKERETKQKTLPEPPEVDNNKDPENGNEENPQINQRHNLRIQKLTGSVNNKKPPSSDSDEKDEDEHSPAPPQNRTGNSQNNKIGSQNNKTGSQNKTASLKNQIENQNQTGNGRKTGNNSTTVPGGASGRIKNLTGFFAEQTDDTKKVKKKRFALLSEEDKDGFEGEGGEGGMSRLEPVVLENEPMERLDGVVRSADPSLWNKPIEVEKGSARQLAMIFQNICTSDREEKKAFQFDIDAGAETIILENEPVILEGVIRSGDKTKDFIGKRGHIKNLAGRFARPNPNESDEGSQERDQSHKIRTTEIESYGDGRNISKKWRDRQEENENEQANNKQSWKKELDTATEYGVYENEPEVRSDVVRADDDQPDIISVQHTRNLKKMWSQFEKEEMNKNSGFKGNNKRVNGEETTPIERINRQQFVVATAPVSETIAKTTNSKQNKMDDNNYDKSNSKIVDNTIAPAAVAEPDKKVPFSKNQLKSMPRKKF